MKLPDGYMTVTQVAEKLGCSESTVRRYAKVDGLVTHMMRGRQRGTYITDYDLRKWIDERLGCDDEEEYR